MDDGACRCALQRRDGDALVEARSQQPVGHQDDAPGRVAGQEDVRSERGAPVEKRAVLQRDVGDGGHRLFEVGRRQEAPEDTLRRAMREDELDLGSRGVVRVRGDDRELGARPPRRSMLREASSTNTTGPGSGGVGWTGNDSGAAISRRHHQSPRLHG